MEAYLAEGDDVDAPNLHKWENLERSWDALQEDESGELNTVQFLQARRKRPEAESLRRGVVRYLVLLVDLSKHASTNDFKPTRSKVFESLVSSFTTEYFNQNPISHISIGVMRNSCAELLTDLTGNSRLQLERFGDYVNKNRPDGDPSLQNALTVAMRSLSSIPSYGSKEVVILLASLRTCDPGDLLALVPDLVREKVRVSFVGVGGEVFVCRHIASSTGGSYKVSLNETHCKELLFEHAVPPPTRATPPSSDGSAPSVPPPANLIRMGFPIRRTTTVPTLCACHKNSTVMGYVCPRCKAKVCELPTDCPICGLTLVLSPHIARSYHHLFPVPNFDEVSREGDGWVFRTASQNAEVKVNSSEHCFGCRLLLPSVATVCGRCLNLYCVDCDDFVHESLHVCAGCDQLAAQQQQDASQNASSEAAPPSSSSTAAAMHGVA